MFFCVGNVFVSVTWAPLRAIEGGIRGSWVTSDDSADTYATVGGPWGAAKCPNFATKVAENA